MVLWINLDETVQLRTNFNILSYFHKILTGYFCNKSTEQRTLSFAVSFVLCVVICLWYVMVTFDYNAFIGVHLLHLLGVN